MTDDRPEMPTSVVVGPYRLTILVDMAAINEASVDDGNALAGVFQAVRGRIVLKPDLTPDYLAESLLHEILHAIVMTTALDHGGHDGEEKVVAALAPTLLDTLRRNPAATAWLTAD